MKNKIEKYLLERAEDLVFITIEESKELSIEGYDVPKDGLKVPMKSEVLVKSIKENKAQEELNMVSMVDAMIYIQGIDSEFVYNEEYDKFIDAFSKKANFDKLQYAGYISTQAYNRGESIESLIYIRSFLRSNPNDIMGLYQYAIICQDMSQRYQKDENIKAMNDFLLEALKALEYIVDIDDSFALAHYQLGFHYLNQSQFLKAKLTWERAIQLGLDDDLVAELQENIDSIDYKVRYEQGYNLVLQGKEEEGLEYLLPLEDSNPDWWNLLFMIGLAYKNTGEIGQAKAYFEKILMLRPTQVDSLVELALCHAAESNLEKAIEYLSRAAKIKKDDPEILCNLGMAYLHNGNYDDARYFIERAYEINPMDEVTIACMKQLG